MSSKHPSFGKLSQTGLLENLHSFSEFEARISALATEKMKGDAFEIFAEAYLATQKITQTKEVWPFQSAPLEHLKTLSLDTPRDMGVDGIYLTIGGKLGAYQAKFRSQRAKLPWAELSTFMGLTDQVGQRVLFTNSEELPVLMGDRKGFFAIRGNDLDRLTADDFSTIRNWLHTGRNEIVRKEPRPHQHEALSNIAKGIETNNRATVVMACGTGKSLVALWAAERHAGQTLLVLVPSLALLRQLLHEWLRETSWQHFGFMCVCSDSTVTRGVDDVVVNQVDLDFPVTTDSAVVRAYLEQPFSGTRIVFSTYQSAQVVAEGMPRDLHGQRQPFDLGIFDEAHKTASRNGTRFSFALEDSNLPIRQRLFFTATPRHFDVRKENNEGDGGALVYSMDRPEIYGPVIHTLSFAEAARRGIICDYKVVISVVTSAMVDDHLLNHGEVLVQGNAVLASQVAMQVALQKAVEKFGPSRIFTFHSTVAAASSFTSKGSEGLCQHLPDFTTLHVSGKMPTWRREGEMRAFSQAGKAVISNARCLTEGVDVPAVDMVAFISPRKSKVDIVQATGRAMRKSGEKEFGYVMVPLFLAQAKGETIEDALQRTGYDDVWDVLNAMREQDDVLVDVIREMKEEKGRAGGYGTERFTELVEVLGPTVSLGTIREAITAACLEKLGAGWDEHYGRLLAFVNSHGHCNVKRDLEYRGFKLGEWVNSQRTDKGILPTERRARLEQVPGWSWNTLDDKWDKGYAQLSAYAEEHGDCLVRTDHVLPTGERLGKWIFAQRQYRKKGILSSERGAKLEALPGWAWDAGEAKWEKGFSCLQQYALANANRLPLSDHVAPDGYRLGQWVGVQRNDYDKGTLRSDRKQRLEALPGWSWDVRTDEWSIGFAHLCAYADGRKEWSISQTHRLPDGFKLGVWANTQRTKQDKMAPDRRQKLESVPGWTWNAREQKWTNGLEHLKTYLAREGHCNVPYKYSIDSFPLGQWVTDRRQAKKKGTLTREHEKQLEALPGWVWAVRPR